MLETYLIIALSVLVLVLLYLVLRRRSQQAGAVLIREEAVRDLINTLTDRFGEVKIQEIAGSVSDILIKHLECDRIFFLKHNRGYLDLNFFYGVKGINRKDFKIRLRRNSRERLKDFHSVQEIDRLDEALPKKYINMMTQHNVKMFFPLLFKDELYGIYIINSTLPADDSTLNLLATALAFNLSSAYHIARQEQRLKRYENRFKGAEKKAGYQGKNLSTTFGEQELLKCLKIRNCQELVPELLNILRKEGQFSRLGLYIKSNAARGEIFAANWNIDSSANKAVEEKFDKIADNLKNKNVLELNRPGGKKDGLDGDLKELREARISHIAEIPWIDRKKAILIWSSKEQAEKVIKQIDNFSEKIIPLAENISRLEKAEELSHTDGLTGLYNFRYFKKRLHEEIQRARRYSRKFALMIFDIDGLKNVNDEHGHLAGDALLKSFARILTDSVRTNDVVFRYAGDEFCLIMPEIDRENALSFMGRIREATVSNKTHIEWAGNQLNYTVSIGGAVFPDDAATTEEIIHAADLALLEAKNGGKNCYRIYHAEISPDK